MTIFESKGAVNKPAIVVYAFLADMNNHGKLMPENVLEWSSTTDEASFSVQNMLKLSLKISERLTDERIKIIAAEKPPFDLEIEWRLLPENDQTKVSITIRAELNMMMKMMASGPLQKLADHEIQSLIQILN